MSIYERVQLVIRRYFHERLFLVALVAILFFMGIIFGALAAGLLHPVQQQELISYINQGLHGEATLSNHVYTRQVIISHIQTIFFLFFMGISVIGVPLALLLIFSRGFILGFSISFLLRNMGLKGALLSIAGILPHHLIMIPGLFLMLIAIIDCAAALTKIRFTKYPVSIGSELLRCSLLTFISLFIMVIAGLVQGYFTPVITLWLSKII